MFVGTRSSDDTAVVEFAPPTDLMSRLQRRFRRERIARDFLYYQALRPADCELFSDDRSPYGTCLLSQLPACDVINLHWLAGFVDYRDFFAAVPKHIPLVWRLADMNPLTGGCHYDDGCGKFTHACGACPQLGSIQENDLSRKIWERKQTAFRLCDPKRLHLVVLSRWMLEQVKQSPLLCNFPVTMIPNGVDLEEFAPRDRRVARDILRIPDGARVVLFIADNATNRRKGFSFLTEALNGLDHQSDLFLLSVGSGKLLPSDRIPYLHLGPIDYRWLSLVYSAADLFVIPSLQDNLPNTVLEAMACGTPVVGFAVGGIPDMVRPGITGLLVPPCDVVGLLAAILDLVHDERKRKEMSSSCRRIAVEEYSLELQARRYSEIYKSLL